MPLLNEEKKENKLKTFDELQRSFYLSNSFRKLFYDIFFRNFARFRVNHKSSAVKI